MMFIVKKILGLLIEPLTVALLLLVLAWALFRWRPRLARFVLFTALTGLYLLSTDPVSDALLIPLERKYPAWVAPIRPVEVVVVLGGGHQTDPELPITSELKSFSLARLTEGVRIWYQSPGSTLVLSGYGGRDDYSNAEVMSQLARQLGVPGHAIEIEPRARDTVEEARLLAPMLMGKNSVLVTSGYHMPRAMALFAGQGITPQPAPTEHLAHRDRLRGAAAWAPSPQDLLKSTRAVHEYAGIAWARLNKQL